jgi:hypothetical protein
MIDFTTILGRTVGVDSDESIGIDIYMNCSSQL